MRGLRVLVTGGNGQFARAVSSIWGGCNLSVLSHKDLDIQCMTSIFQAVQGLRPNILINAAAFTHVDGCEQDPGLAMQVNGASVGWLAEACNSVDALLVQISTDYVFDGEKSAPYTEFDAVNPVSVYGRSKLLGEGAARLAREHLILRTGWLYDGWGRNFYQTMQRAAEAGKSLRVVDDQIGTPTTCRSLARQMKVAVKEEWRGIVHATCHGETSWHRFAAEIFRQGNLPSADLRPCSTGEFETLARRPAYSVLDGSRRGALGTDVMPEWREALSEVISNPELI